MARGSAALCAAQRSSALCALAILLCCASVHGGFVVETGQLSVETPAGYGPYDMSVANFGRTVYGGQLRGQLVYQRSNGWGCTPFQTRFASSLGSEPGIPVIALIDRGGPPGQAACAFTTKSLNAQNAGAAAVLIVDNREESLITMDGGEDDDSQREEAQISVPCALVQQSAGVALKGQLAYNVPAVATMSWADIVPRSASVVAWELWSNSNDECGLRCDRQKQLLLDLAPAVEALMSQRQMTFVPHYITLKCELAYAPLEFCQKQCLNAGRYCAQDPDGNLDAGFSGRDVVLANLHSLCAYRTFDASATPWLWWRYVTRVGRECSMRGGTYSTACADSIAQQLGASANALTACVGNPDADAPNTLLDLEQAGMRNSGRRGDISLFPTLIANGVQYRGDLNNVSVMAFLCAGYPAGAAPALCTARGVVAAACAARSGDGGDGATRCTDTPSFPYWQCSCPLGQTLGAGADGTPHCLASNACLTRAAGVAACACPTCVCQVMPAGSPAPFRCTNVTVDECAGYNGGCWQGTVDSAHFTACRADLGPKRAAGLAGLDPDSVRGYSCVCPPGFRGDGVASCVDVNECRETPPPGACPGAHMSCINQPPGSFTCGCEPGFAMDVAAHVCVATAAAAGGRSGPPAGTSAGGVFGIVLLTMCCVAGAGYALYRWRLRKHMSDEIRAIMSNYLPLDAQQDEAMDFRPLRGSAEEESELGAARPAGSVL